MVSGWKVLRRFWPDGAVLELYTGLVLKTGWQPAFAPETNLTLASSVLPCPVLSLPGFLPSHGSFIPTPLSLTLSLSPDFDLCVRPGLNVIHGRGLINFRDMPGVNRYSIQLDKVVWQFFIMKIDRFTLEITTYEITNNIVRKINDPHCLLYRLTVEPKK